MNEFNLEALFSVFIADESCQQRYPTCDGVSSHFPLLMEHD